VVVHERFTGKLDSPQVVANFYDGETFEGHFGVGPSFF
jgi:hypothetical protein